MVEMRHLRYFVAVAEELHFGRAAARLHMSQPPLSQQIRQLEGRLGFELFHRTKRRVQLTVAGHAFLTESRRILDLLERAIRIGEQTSRGEHGELAMGFVSSASYSVLPSVLRRFRRSYPGVEVILRELPAGMQIASLVEKRIDIGLARPPIEHPDLETITIYEEPLVVALPAHHSLGNARCVSLSDLSVEPFVLFPRDLAPGLYDQIISLCQQAGFSPRVVQEASQMQTIVSLVAADIGVAIVPGSVRNVQRPGLVYKPLGKPIPKTALALIHRKADPSPVVHRFLDLMRASAGTFGERDAV